MQLSAHSLMIIQFPGILSLSLLSGTGNMKGGQLQWTLSILFVWRSLMLMFFPPWLEHTKFWGICLLPKLNTFLSLCCSQMCNTFYIPWYLFLFSITPINNFVQSWVSSSDYWRVICSPRISTASPHLIFCHPKYSSMLCCCFSWPLLSWKIFVPLHCYSVEVINPTSKNN